MSEQGAPPEGTPAVAGPEGTPGTAEPQVTQDADEGWQQRYVDIQREYTRSQQENSLFRQLLSDADPDTRREIAEQLGYTLEEEEEPQQPDPNGDPLVQYDERLSRIEQSQTLAEQEREEAAYVEQLQAVVTERLDGLGIDDGDKDWVLAYAVNALPPTDEGLPDLEQAKSVFQARETERQRAWAQSKRAPHISPHGQPATEVPNLDNRQERQDWMTRRLQDNEQAGF